jgi:hypothetical protein
MKNRAKCKLCESIIESFHSTHYDMCKCGEISVDGGDSMKCYAKDFANFLRVDDEGNIIVPTIKSCDEGMRVDIEVQKPTKKDIIEMMQNMINSFESLPQHALHQSINHIDMLNFMIIVLAAFKSDSDS